MIRYIFILFISTFPFLSHGQTTWTGQVVDNENQPISYANVLMLRSVDTTLVQGDLTDLDGKFTIKGMSNDLLLQIHMIGYQETYIELSHAQSDLGTILLAEATELLDEVQIIAKKPLYEQKIDRTVINVENSIVNAGNSALNVLSRSPSVVLDRSNQELSLMGNQGVSVMINNKIIMMEGEELINYLESLSSDQIKSIELIPNPPASYDAQGSAGIININLSKTSSRGTTGSASLHAGYGNRPKYGGSLALNYVNNKLHSYAVLSSNNNNTLEISDFQRQFELAGSPIQADIHRERDSYVGLHTMDVGASYDISDKHEIGSSLTLQHRNWQLDSESFAERIHGDERFDLINMNDEENLLNRFIANMHYIYKQSEERALSFDIDYISFHRQNPTTYHAETLPEVGSSFTSEFMTDTETRLKVIVGSLDYTFKVSDKINGESGLKLTQSRFSNYTSFMEELNDEIVFDPFFTDKFNLEENITAGYLSFSGKLSSKLSFKSGLRYEQYGIDLRSENTGEVLNRNNGRFYPNLFLTYQMTDKLAATLSYTERIERPGFLNLAPAFYFYTQYELFTGNPELIPSISKRLKLDLRWNTLNISLLGSQIDYPIFQFTPTFIDQKNILATQPSQAKVGYSVSLSASQPINILERWKSRVNLNVNFLDQRPIIRGAEVRSKSYNYNAVLTNTVDISPTVSVELNGQYFSKLKYSAFDLKSRLGIDFGFSKTIKEDSKLTLNIVDIFNTSSIWMSQMNVPEANYFLDGNFDFEGPIVRLSFSTKFGRSDLKTKNKRVSKSSEEIQRTQ